MRKLISVGVFAIFVLLAVFSLNAQKESQLIQLKPASSSDVVKGGGQSFINHFEQYAGDDGGVRTADRTDELPELQEKVAVIHFNDLDISR